MVYLFFHMILFNVNLLFINVMYVNIFSTSKIYNYTKTSLKLLDKYCSNGEAASGKKEIF